MGVEVEASRHAMEAADVIKGGGTELMPTTTPDPPETGGVEAMRTDKVKPSRSAGTVARKATEKASAGKSAPIRREPHPETVLLCTHNVGEGRSLIFTLVKGMFTIIKKGTNDWIE